MLRKEVTMITGTPRKISEVTEKDRQALPLYIKQSIDSVVRFRRGLGLVDDTDERIENACKYRKHYPDK